MALSTHIDLHIHSTYSDGMLRPSEIVDLAASRGVAAISITDHDTADGTGEAVRRGAEKGVVPGMVIPPCIFWDTGSIIMTGSSITG
jgi:predicted metal-dependent phosphoesterase TrpH